MTPEQFCYWLQGYAEISASQPTQEQWDVIKEHLGLVFNKLTTKSVTPPPTPKLGGLEECLKRRINKPLDWQSIPEVIC